MFWKSFLVVVLMILAFAAAAYWSIFGLKICTSEYVYIEEVVGFGTGEQKTFETDWPVTPRGTSIVRVGDRYLFPREYALYRDGTLELDQAPEQEEPMMFTYLIERWKPAFESGSGKL